jgi:hypothetical protein
MSDRGDAVLLEPWRQEAEVPGGRGGVRGVCLLALRSAHEAGRQIWGVGCLRRAMLKMFRQRMRREPVQRTAAH